MSPNLAIGCIGAVIFGIGNGIGLVCNVTLIQQVVSDDRRGQIFAVLGSLVQFFTLIGTLAAGPIARLNVPGLLNELPMEEKEPGVYAAAYLVRPEDRTTGDGRVAATLRSVPALSGRL